MARYAKIDLVDLAEKLMKWCELHNSISLMGFCSDHHISQKFLYESAKKDEEFGECLQVAKAKLGSKREQKAAKGEMPVLMYSRCASMYDKALDKHDRDTVAFEAKIKSSAQAPPAPPRDEILAAQNENMLLRHEIHSLKEQIKLQNEIDNS